MLEIRFTKEIEAPCNIVWSVITNAHEYAEWNEFVTSCRSSFEVGSPIKMKVRVLPFFSMPQQETIRRCEDGCLIEYGFCKPLGMLSSSRHHILTSTGEAKTRYESVLVLKGWLAPIVRLMLGRQLRRGFGDMTEGIACRSEQIYKRQ